MNRKTFLKKLGLGAAAVAVVPKLMQKKPEIICSADSAIPGGDITVRGKFPRLIPADLIPDGRTLKQIINEWHRTGLIIYSNQCLPNPK